MELKRYLIAKGTISHKNHHGVSKGIRDIIQVDGDNSGNSH